MILRLVLEIRAIENHTVSRGVSRETVPLGLVCTKVAGASKG